MIGLSVCLQGKLQREIERLSKEIAVSLRDADKDHASLVEAVHGRMVQRCVFVVLCVCLCVEYVYVYLCSCLFFVCLFVCMYVCIYIYTHTHTYIHTHIHTYIHTHTHTHTQRFWTPRLQ